MNTPPDVRKVVKTGIRSAVEVICTEFEIYNTVFKSSISCTNLKGQISEYDSTLLWGVSSPKCL